MKTLDIMNESVVDKYADHYNDKYRTQVDAFSKYSMLAKCGESVTASDIYALGQQLEQYEQYQSFVESIDSIGSLGQIPSVALDVLTASFGSSIIPLVASTQAIQEESGIIYFKQIKAADNGYGRNAGDLISSPLSGGSYSSTYGSYEVNAETIGTIHHGEVTTTITLTKSPARPHTVEITIPDLNLRAIDDGRGIILGNGLHGIINYGTTGSAATLTLNFADPATTHNIIASYGVNVEKSDGVVGIAGSLDSTPIRAEVYSLRSETGLLQEYSFQKRFGKLAQEEIAADLTSELTRVINTVAIRRLDAACTLNESWSRTAPPGVSYSEHKLTFIDAYASAENKLNAAAGRGNISRMICGTNAAAVLRGMPGFTTVDTALNQSVGLYGYLNGIPVIRASQIISTDSILCFYKGTSYFESPLVNAPYMPLFISNTMTTGTNPLRNQRVAAIWTGLKVVIPNFLVRINITV